MANRLQEVGLLLTMILFCYSALVAALNVKEKNLGWSKWVFTTLIFVGYTFVLPAYQFSANANVSMLPSMMASREFLIVFICPTLYFLTRIGYQIETINKIIIYTLAAVTYSYVFHYFRIDLATAYNSSDPTIKGMVTNDHRGYRLKAPGTAIFLTTIISGYLSVTEKNIKNKAFWVLTFLVCLWCHSVIQSRAGIALLIIGVIFYNAWFSRKNRINIFLLSLTLLIPIYAFAIIKYFEFMEASDGGVRYKSYMIAIETIINHPAFGFGQQSAATITEQELFWYKFYSSDLGIIGIAFRYGIVGATFYIVMLIIILKKSVTTCWTSRDVDGAINALMMASVVRLSGDVFNTLLAIKYASIQGLTHASIIIAFCAVYKIKNKRNLYEK
ncbi:hypothetical protein XMD579_001166 [Marinobacterium sp. xm-d-579]|uniref:O-antigen ligase family protein n=1 Tax=Marinobacterium sp. xm-d-579 TaxID=2497734 RepID=UPI00156910E5|nr:O-antigen ligase family protein [Marinobacterium sp. xm-d-579]NRP36353.1 hypothetical protein [Marinobacterium sp. xm-d-579]